MENKTYADYADMNRMIYDYLVAVRARGVGGAVDPNGHVISYPTWLLSTRPDDPASAETGVEVVWASVSGIVHDHVNRIGTHRRGMGGIEAVAVG